MVQKNPKQQVWKLDENLLRPGMRVAAAVSGGADSVALTLALAECATELGIVLQTVHVNHGLRGAESDEDEAFVRELAQRLGLELRVKRVDTEAERAGDGIEETARRLRYAWWDELMADRVVDAVATAHTLDDQAETVLGKLLRGAWTEGLAGIFPVVERAQGRIVRPMLGVRRSQVEAWLRERGQTWREDSSNREMAFTRNRIRHELLPELEQWNPQLKLHLAHMATLAAEEEAYWAAEMDRLAASLVMQGQPVRGGGRSAGETVAVDVVRLAGLPVAVQRRLLRRAAQQAGATADFEAAEGLRKLAMEGRAGEKRTLAGGWMAERTARELRLSQGAGEHTALEPRRFPVPGKAEALGWRFSVEGCEPDEAVVRPWRAGDRVRLRHSSGPKKVKEVLERMKVTGADRQNWLVMECGGLIVWMQGVDVESCAEVVAKRIP
jgi:tRNA(Ile)-lysidine synthase